MALNITDTSWSGPAASYMITRAVVDIDTIQKKCIYVEDDIRKKKAIPRIEVKDFIQRRTATPTSTGNQADVDGQVLDPKDLMLYYEFNPRDFEAHFYAEQLQPRLLTRELPVTAENFMVMQTMKRLNEYFENHIWRGRIDYDPLGAAVNPVVKGDTADAAAYFYFDGLIKKLLDAALLATNPTIVVGTPLILVSGTAGAGQENVTAALNRTYNLAPKALLFKYGMEGLKFHVSYNTQKLYERDLELNTFKNQDTTQRGINRYRGYEIVPLAGMPDNTIVLCISKPDLDSNLWLGINSKDDNQLQMARVQANSELFFLKGLFKMDTQVGFPDEIVLYTTLIA